jgi:hypothetical protein
MVGRVYDGLSTTFSFLPGAGFGHLVWDTARVLGGFREHDCIRQVMYVQSRVVVIKDTPPIVNINDEAIVFEYTTGTLLPE